MAAPSNNPYHSHTFAELHELPTVYRDDALAGRVVLVTGAAGGIGSAISVLCARLGASLVLCGRTASSLDELAGKLRSRGTEVITRTATVRDPEQVAGVVDAAWDVAQGVVYLAAPSAAFITGTTLEITGGDTSGASTGPSAGPTTSRVRPTPDRRRARAAQPAITLATAEHDARTSRPSTEARNRRTVRCGPTTRPTTCPTTRANGPTAAYSSTVGL